jgi:hypothetical protein
MKIEEMDKFQEAQFLAECIRTKLDELNVLMDAARLLSVEVDMFPYYATSGEQSYSIPDAQQFNFKADVNYIQAL